MSDTEDPSKLAKIQDTLYVLPRHKEERHRLIVQSHLLLRTFDNKAIHAPVELKDDDWVLDAGTGTGAWLQDVVEQIPTKLQYVGIDIKPTFFPEASIRPPNVKFDIQSVTALPKQWKNKFTLVHQRLLLSGLRKHEWETEIREVYGVLKPGGWVQLLEWRAWSSGPALAKFQEAFHAFSDDVGLMLRDITLQLPELLKQAGFIDIHEATRHVPSNPSRGQDGVDGKMNIMGVLRGHKEAILGRGGYGIIDNDAEFDELMDDISKEIDHTPESTLSFTMFWAQKPVE